MTRLPPGQRKADGFPRFGGPSKPPAVPANPALEITGAVREPVTMALSELSTLPRTEQTSDFHCVAGWNPHAAFHRRSHRAASAASASE
jgi:DMSO/TMAO reductase YedYZ molybdopterin-dependent catalytic subunit